VAPVGPRLLTAVDSLQVAVHMAEEVPPVILVSVVYEEVTALSELYGEQPQRELTGSHRQM